MEESNSEEKVKAKYVTIQKLSAKGKIQYHNLIKESIFLSSCWSVTGLAGSFVICSFINSQEYPVKFKNPAMTLVTFGVGGGMLYYGYQKAMSNYRKGLVRIVREEENPVIVKEEGEGISVENKI